MPTIALTTTLAKDAKSITIKDTTLDYGTPPTKSLVRIKPWKGSASSWVVLNTPMVDNVVLGTALGYTDGTIPDGVLDVEYVPFLGTLSGDYPVDTKTIVPVAWAPGTINAQLISYAYANSTIYTIDWTKAQTNVLLNTKETNLAGTTGVSTLYGGAETGFRILNTKGAQACIVGKIGAMVSDCGCNGAGAGILEKLIRWRFAADVEFDCLNYQGAQDLLDSINAYCGCPS